MLSHTVDYDYQHKPSPSSLQTRNFYEKMVRHINKIPVKTHRKESLLRQISIFLLFSLSLSVFLYFFSLCVCHSLTRSIQLTLSLSLYFFLSLLLSTPTSSTEAVFGGNSNSFVRCFWRPVCNMSRPTKMLLKIPAYVQLDCLLIM